MNHRNTVPGTDECLLTMSTLGQDGHVSKCACQPWGKWKDRLAQRHFQPQKHVVRSEPLPVVEFLIAENALQKSASGIFVSNLLLTVWHIRATVMRNLSRHANALATVVGLCAGAATAVPAGVSQAADCRALCQPRPRPHPFSTWRGTCASSAVTGRPAANSQRGGETLS